MCKMSTFWLSNVFHSHFYIVGRGLACWIIAVCVTKWRKSLDRFPAFTFQPVFAGLIIFSCIFVYVYILYAWFVYMYVVIPDAEVHYRPYSSI